jgi:hypothetical protein
MQNCDRMKEISVPKGNAKTKTKRIYILCPVRDAIHEERQLLDAYVANQEKQGTLVYYPPRDTDQSDPIGTKIMRQNSEGVRTADEVHIYWNGKSAGSLFDFGMTYILDKPIVLINPEAIKKMTVPGKKSFENTLIALSMLRT